MPRINNLALGKPCMRRHLSLILLLCAGLFVGGCSRSSDVGPDDGSADKPLAVATTGPVGAAVRRVAGDRLRVEVMMGPGIDPHSYKAVPSDLRKLDSAAIIFYNGLHLEGRMADVFERMSRKKTVVSLTAGLVASEDTRLIHPEDYEGLHDPHVWHDVQLWSDCVQHLCDELCKFDPEGAEAYRVNAAAYRQEMAELHEECVARLAEVPESARMMVTAHDAFAYFSRAYGLESVGLKGVSTEDEVDLGQMERIAVMLTERKAPCVFIETAVSPHIVEALVEACAAKGHTVGIGGELYADAIGPAGSGADTYIGMIRANVETIVNGLMGKKSEE